MFVLVFAKQTLLGLGMPWGERLCPAIPNLRFLVSGPWFLVANFQPCFLLMSTEFLGKKSLCAESKALASVGVDPLRDEFRQDGVDVATQEKMREGVSQGKRGDQF